MQFNCMANSLSSEIKMNQWLGSEAVWRNQRQSAYLAHLCTSASSTLASVDGTEEKGYERLPPLDESVAMHLCPPTAIGWKEKVAHLSKPCRSSEESLHALHGCAPGLSGQTPPMHGWVRTCPRSFQGAAQCNRLGPASYKDNSAGHRQVNAKFSGAGEPLLAKPHGDQRGWQGPFPRLSSLLYGGV